MTQPKELNYSAIQKATKGLPNYHEVRFDNEHIEIVFKNLDKALLLEAASKTFGDTLKVQQFSRAVAPDESPIQVEGIASQQQQQRLQIETSGLRFSISEIQNKNFPLVEKLAELAKNLVPNPELNQSGVTGDLKTPATKQKEL